MFVYFSDAYLETEPIIVVLMHHGHIVKVVPKVNLPYYKAALVVNVFFHETIPGLLKCPQNDEAIASIKAKLQSLST